jgi:hypothetical protein
VHVLLVVVVVVVVVVVAVVVIIIADVAAVVSGRWRGEPGTLAVTGGHHRGSVTRRSEAF